MYIFPIIWGTPEYDEAVQLRYDILRKPLGLEYSPEQLAEEFDQLHLGAYDSAFTLIAYLNLTRVDEKKMKMRQVAVAIDWQKKGVGKKLVLTSEQMVKSLEMDQMVLHARESAVPFYLKLGYSVVGKEFQEVGIPHRRMEKNM